MLLGFGLATYMAWNKSKSECASAKTEGQPESNFIRNTLTSRAFVLQYPANEPCEDRFNVYQFKNTNAYYAGVFDGHGGWQVSDYAMRKMHTYLDEALKGANTENDIKKALIQAYNQVEADWV